MHRLNNQNGTNKKNKNKITLIFIVMGLFGFLFETFFFLEKNESQKSFFKEAENADSFDNYILLSDVKKANLDSRQSHIILPSEKINYVAFGDVFSYGGDSSTYEDNLPYFGGNLEELKKFGYTDSINFLRGNNYPEILVSYINNFEEDKVKFFKNFSRKNESLNSLLKKLNSPDTASLPEILAIKNSNLLTLSLGLEDLLESLEDSNFFEAFLNSYIIEDFYPTLENIFANIEKKYYDLIDKIRKINANILINNISYPEFFINVKKLSDSNSENIFRYLNTKLNSLIKKVSIFTNTNFIVPFNDKKWISSNFSDQNLFNLLPNVKGNREIAREIFFKIATPDNLNLLLAEYYLNPSLQKGEEIFKRALRFYPNLDRKYFLADAGTFFTNVQFAKEDQFFLYSYLNSDNFLDSKSLLQSSDNFTDDLTVIEPKKSSILDNENIYLFLKFALKVVQKKSQNDSIKENLILNAVNSNFLNKQEFISFVNKNKILEKLLFLQQKSKSSLNNNFYLDFWQDIFSVVDTEKNNSFAKHFSVSFLSDFLEKYLLKNILVSQFSIFREKNDSFEKIIEEYLLFQKSKINNLASKIFLQVEKLNFKISDLESIFSIPEMRKYIATSITHLLSFLEEKNPQMITDFLQSPKIGLSEKNQELIPYLRNILVVFSSFEKSDLISKNIIDKYLKEKSDLTKFSEINFDDSFVYQLFLLADSKNLTLISGVQNLIEVVSKTYFSVAKVEQLIDFFLDFTDVYNPDFVGLISFINLDIKKILKSLKTEDETKKIKYKKLANYLFSKWILNSNFVHNLVKKLLGPLSESLVKYLNSYFQFRNVVLLDELNLILETLFLTNFFNNKDIQKFISNLIDKVIDEKEDFLEENNFFVGIVKENGFLETVFDTVFVDLLKNPKTNQILKKVIYRLLEKLVDLNLSEKSQKTLKLIIENLVDNVFSLDALNFLKNDLFNLIRKTKVEKNQTLQTGFGFLSGLKKWVQERLDLTNLNNLQLVFEILNINYTASNQEIAELVTELVIKKQKNSKISNNSSLKKQIPKANQQLVSGIFYKLAAVTESKNNQARLTEIVTQIFANLVKNRDFFEELTSNFKISKTVSTVFYNLISTNFEEVEFIVKKIVGKMLIKENFSELNLNYFASKVLNEFSQDGDFINRLQSFFVPILKSQEIDELVAQLLINKYFPGQRSRVGKLTSIIYKSKISGQDLGIFAGLEKLILQIFSEENLFADNYNFDFNSGIGEKFFLKLVAKIADNYQKSSDTTKKSTFRNSLKSFFVDFILDKQILTRLSSKNLFQNSSFNFGDLLVKLTNPLVDFIVKNRQSSDVNFLLDSFIDNFLKDPQTTTFTNFYQLKNLIVKNFIISLEENKVTKILEKLVQEPGILNPIANSLIAKIGISQIKAKTVEYQKFTTFFSELISAFLNSDLWKNLVSFTNQSVKKFDINLDLGFQINQMTEQLQKQLTKILPGEILVILNDNRIAGQSLVDFINLIFDNSGENSTIVDYLKNVNEDKSSNYNQLQNEVAKSLGILKFIIEKYDNDSNASELSQQNESEGSEIKLAKSSASGDLKGLLLKLISKIFNVYKTKNSDYSNVGFKQSSPEFQALFRFINTVVYFLYKKYNYWEIREGIFKNDNGKPTTSSFSSIKNVFWNNTYNTYSLVGIILNCLYDLGGKGWSGKGKALVNAIFGGQGGYASWDSRKYDWWNDENYKANGMFYIIYNSGAGPNTKKQDSSVAWTPKIDRFSNGNQITMETVVFRALLLGFLPADEENRKKIAGSESDFQSLLATKNTAATIIASDSQ